jgi:4-carboxymuconolactone decarboxylase
MSRRFPQITKEQLNEGNAALAEKIFGVSSVGIGGPYNLLLRSPVLGDRMFELFRYLRWNTSVPLRLNEFAILIIGRIWRSQVEWYAHVPIALKAGLSQSIIDDLKAQRRPQNMQADEAAVYDYVTELANTRKVSDEVFEKLKAVLNEQQIVDLTATAGTYVTVAMLLSISEEQVPEGKQAPFSDKDP